MYLKRLEMTWFLTKTQVIHVNQPVKERASQTRTSAAPSIWAFGQLPRAARSKGAKMDASVASKKCIQKNYSERSELLIVILSKGGKIDTNVYFSGRQLTHSNILYISDITERLRHQHFIFFGRRTAAKQIFSGCRLRLCSRTKIQGKYFVKNSWDTYHT